MFKVFGISAFAIFGLMGCSSVATVDSASVDEEALYGKYSFVYDPSGRSVSSKSWAHAQLRVGGRGGTTVKLSSPSTLKLNGQNMKVTDGDKAGLNLLGTYYSYADGQAPAPRVEFEWTRLDGQVHINGMDWFSNLSYQGPAHGDQIKVADGFLVSFPASNFQDPDAKTSISCGLWTMGSASQQELVARRSGKISCDFTAQKLANAPTGEVLELRIEMHKRFTGTLDGHAVEGGRMTFTYHHPSVDIELLP